LLREQRDTTIEIEFVGSVSQASGDYVLLLGRQAILMPGALRIFVEVAENTGADLVSSLENVADEANSRPGFRRLWAGLDSTLGLLRNCFGGNCVLVRRTALAGLGRSAEVESPSWKMLARAVLQGFRLEIIPEPLFMTPAAQGGSATERSDSLEVYLEEVPRHYRELLRLTQGQAVRVERLERELARQRDSRPLRYRIADRLLACLSRVPLLPGILRFLLGKLFRA
jgi:hypothetical protein